MNNTLCYFYTPNRIQNNFINNRTLSAAYVPPPVERSINRKFKRKSCYRSGCLGLHPRVYKELRGTGNNGTESGEGHGEINFHHLFVAQ